MTERAERRLLDLKARQEAGEHMMCPRCGRDAMKAPVHTNALSRTADVYVCDACGTAEAMLAFMKQDYPLHLWGAFQPVRPPADFKEHSARAVMDTVLRTQSDELRRLYQLCRDDPGNAEWYRLEAFESCPGLIELRCSFGASSGLPALRSCGHSPSTPSIRRRTARCSSDSGTARTAAFRWRRT
mgnify:CR=1 FL=1